MPRLVPPCLPAVIIPIDGLPSTEVGVFILISLQEVLSHLLGVLEHVLMDQLNSLVY